MMFWMIIAAAVWIFNLLFIRIQGLKKLWSVVFWSLLLAFFLNEPFVQSGIYLFHHMNYPLREIPLEYLLASAGKGVIIIRYLPEEKWWQLIYLVFFAAAVTAIEYYALAGGYLEYVQWSLQYSFIFRLAAYITLAWLSSLTVRQARQYYYR